MGDCQILALTKFNLQPELCPLSTCLLFKTLMKRFIGLVYPSLIWSESLLCHTCLPLCCPLQSRAPAPAMLSVLKQIKSHWQTLSTLSSPLCFALSLRRQWQNCFGMCIASQPVSLPLPMFPFAFACPLWFLQWQNYLHPSRVSWHLWLAAELQKDISHKCARWLRHQGGTTSTYQAVADLETSCHPPSRSHVTAFQRCHSPFPCLHKVPRRMWPGAV